MPHPDPVTTRLIREFHAVRNDRVNWEGGWRSTARFVLPSNDFLPHNTQTSIRSRGVYDETAIDANIQLASAQFALLTNPATKWFLLSTGDPVLDELRPVRLWLDDIRDRMLAAFGRERSGFYANLYQAYLIEQALGTCGMYIDRLPGGGPRFVTVPLSELFLRDNPHNRTNAVHRATNMTWRQIGELFGDAARAIPQFSEKVVSHPEEHTLVLHIVEPRENRNPEGVGARNMPFASWYLHEPTKTLLSEGGFRTMPYNMFFWQKMPGETYGRGPGICTLRTIRLVNEMWRTTLKGMQKIVDPPLFAPHDTFVTPLRISPGSLSFYRSGSAAAGGPGEVVQSLSTGGRPDLALGMIEAQREQIRKAFHMNLLVMREGDRMTATEINQRAQEMRMLSPFVSRTQQTLDGIIRRVYDIMLHDMMFPVPPPELSGAQLRVEYTSPLTRAQRLGEIEATFDLAQVFAPFQALMPEETAAALQNFNLDEVFRSVAHALDYPEANLRSPEEVAVIREQQAQAAQLAQLAAVGKDAGAGIRDASQGAVNLSQAAAPTGA